MWNHTSLQTKPLKVLFITTAIENNICNTETEPEYDPVYDCYKFPCIEIHLVYATLTLGKYEPVVVVDK